MAGCLKSCVGKASLLVLLVFLGFAAWMWGPSLSRGTREAAGEPNTPSEPSPELAEATLDRFEAFQAGRAGDQLHLGATEISSLLRFALPGILPPGVDAPTVTLRDSHLVFSARVALASLPELPSLGDVVDLLPDTVTVEAEGTLALLDAEWIAVHVDGMEAGPLPLPDRLIPDVLRALGRREVPHLPPDAVAFPLPEGLRAAYVVRDSLVLFADR